MTTTYRSRRVALAAAAPGPTRAACTAGALPSRSTGTGVAPDEPPIRSAAVSTGDVCSGTSGSAPADLDPDQVFVSPYACSSALTAAASVDADVRGGAGPH